MNLIFESKIILLLVPCILSKVPTEQYENEVCQYEVATSRGRISANVAMADRIRVPPSEALLDRPGFDSHPGKIIDCSWETSNKTRRWSPFEMGNLEARWSPMSNKPEKLLLAISFSIKGSGAVKVILSSSKRNRNPIFCGILNLRQSQKKATFSAINVWLQCRQNEMKLKDKLALSLDKVNSRTRRSLPEVLNVALPGCTMPQFKHSLLCEQEADKKIRFHVQRVPGRRFVKVVLSNTVYTSKFEDEKVAKARRYYVAISEEPPAEEWLGVGEGKMVQRITLNYPNRKVRFRNLVPKLTYVISVWKVGNVKKYFKKITLC